MKKSNKETSQSLYENKRGRPTDIYSFARNSIKELRGDAKRLETISKRINAKAMNLKNEIDAVLTFTIKTEQPNEDFSHIQKDISRMLKNSKDLNTIAKQMRDEADELNNEVKLQNVRQGNNGDSFFMAHSSFGYGSVEMEMGETRKDNVIEMLPDKETRTKKAIEMLFTDVSADEMWDEIGKERDRE